MSDREPPRTYVFRVPIRGEWYGTVTAESAAEARRKVDERHPDADGFEAEINWSGKARVRLDRPKHRDTSGTIEPYKAAQFGVDRE